MNKAIFWVLLGTLGGDSKTLINDGFNFFAEAIPALQQASRRGYYNIIITNQSHISHGRMSLDDYESALKELLADLASQNVSIKEVYT